MLILILYFKKAKKDVWGNQRLTLFLTKITEKLMRESMNKEFKDKNANDSSQIVENRSY